jgi:hypothetical protein
MKYKFTKSVLFLLLVCLTVAVWGYYFKHPVKLLSPLPDNYLPERLVVVYAKEEETELQQITNYIIKLWEPFGRKEAVKALDCFISESKLNPNAYGWNEWNKTADVGVAQINDIHGLTVEQRKDWKFNLDKALELYKRSGFRPWYGSGCK